jgi:hypothetical protein
MGWCACPASGATSAYLRWGHPEHLAHGVIALTDAPKASSESDVRDGQRGGRQQQPCGLCAVCATQRFRSSTKLGEQQAIDVARGVSEVTRKALNALTVDVPINDQSHGARGDVFTNVPLRTPWRDLREATLARPESGTVRRRACRVESNAIRFWGPRRATGPTIDPCRVHCRHKLAVKAPIPCADDAVALVMEALFGCHAVSVAHRGSQT